MKKLLVFFWACFVLQAQIIPFTPMTTGTVASVWRSAIGLDVAAPTAVGTNLLTATSATTARTALDAMKAIPSTNVVYGPVITNEWVQLSAPYHTEGDARGMPLSLIFGRSTPSTINVIQDGDHQYESHGFGFVGDRSTWFAGRQEPGWVFKTATNAFEPQYLAQYSTMGGWKSTAWGGTNNDTSVNFKGQTIFGYANYGAASFASSLGQNNFVLGPRGYAIGAENLVGGQFAGVVSLPTSSSDGANYANYVAADAPTLDISGDVTSVFASGTIVLLRSHLSTDPGGLTLGTRTTWGIITSSSYGGGVTTITLDRRYRDGVVDLATTGWVHPVVTTTGYQSDASGASGYKNVVMSPYSHALGSRHYIAPTNGVNSSPIQGAIAVGDSARPSNGQSLTLGTFSEWGAGSRGQYGIVMLSTVPWWGQTETVASCGLRVRVSSASNTNAIDCGNLYIPTNSTVHMEWVVVGRRVDTGAPETGTRGAEHSGVATFSWDVKRSPSGTVTTLATPSPTYSTGSSAKWYLTNIVATTSGCQVEVQTASLGNSNYEFSGDTYSVITANSTFDAVTGMAYSNMSDGKFYCVLTDGGGGNHVMSLYKSSTISAGNKVAHTAGYSTSGSKALTADNGSGIGGNIVVGTPDSRAWGETITAQVYPVFMTTASVRMTEIIEPPGGL